MQLRLRLVAVVSRRITPCASPKANTTPWCKIAFKSIKLLPATAVLLPLVNAYIKEAFSYYKKASFTFNAEHLKNLLKTTVNLFCASYGWQLNLYYAAHLLNLSYKGLESHVAHFMYISSYLTINREEVITSALDFNAHPPKIYYA